MMKKLFGPEDYIRISGDVEALERIDETIVQNRVNKFISDTQAETSFVPTPQEVQEFAFAQQKALKKNGKNRFSRYFKQMFDEDVDIDVTVTDERINRVVAIQQLKDMLIAFGRLPVASKFNPDAIMAEILNLMGLRGEFFLQQPRIPRLTAQAGEAGRLQKNAPEQAPTEVGGALNAAGVPGLGQGVSGPASTGPAPESVEMLQRAGALQ
jgi:RNase H-fold protein (predicted Holliday junction resolvase)